MEWKKEVTAVMIRKRNTPQHVEERHACMYTQISHKHETAQHGQDDERSSKGPNTEMYLGLFAGSTFSPWRRVLRHELVLLTSELLSLHVLHDYVSYRTTFHDSNFEENEHVDLLNEQPKGATKKKKRRRRKSGRQIQFTKTSCIVSRNSQTSIGEVKVDEMIFLSC